MSGLGEANERLEQAIPTGMDRARKETMGRGGDLTYLGREAGCTYDPKQDSVARWGFSSASHPLPAGEATV